jgi:predicted nucleotidyltransferase
MADFGLSDYTMNTLRTLLQKYRGIEKAVIYGSRALGNVNEKSGV